MSSTEPIPKLAGPLMGRVATAPISWGICEVPGWGEQLPATRVATEMASLGFAATELGEFGFFPSDPAELRTWLEPHGLEMIGGFVSLVLHDPAEADTSLAEATRIADFFAASGSTFFNSAAVTTWDWAPRQELTADQWAHLSHMLARVGEICAERGLTQVLHPHVDTVVETGDEIIKVLDTSDVDFVFDTAHFAVGGCDPLAFALEHSDRVGLVHLKDVDTAVATRLNAEEITLLEAVQAGVFQTLGEGDLPMAEIIVALENSGYANWYVLEQDVALTTGAPPEGSGPVAQVKLSLDFLRSVEAERLGGDGESR